jgi:hypothetical protein
MTPKLESKKANKSTPVVTLPSAYTELAQAVKDPTRAADPKKVALRRGGVRSFKVTDPFDLFQAGLIHKPIALELTARYLSVQQDLPRLNNDHSCIVYQAAKKGEKREAVEAAMAILKSTPSTDTYVAIQRRNKITLLSPRGKEITRKISKKKRDAAENFWKEEEMRRKEVLKRALKDKPVFSTGKRLTNSSQSVENCTLGIAWLLKIDQCGIRLEPAQVDDVCSFTTKGILEGTSHPILPADPQRLERIAHSTDPKIALEEKQVAFLQLSLHFLRYHHIFPRSFSASAEALLAEAAVYTGKRKLQWS